MEHSPAGNTGQQKTRKRARRKPRSKWICLCVLVLQEMELARVPFPACFAGASPWSPPEQEEGAGCCTGRGSPAAGSPLRSAPAPLCCSLAPAPPSEGAPSLGSAAPSGLLLVEKSLALKLPFRDRIKGDLVGGRKEKRGRPSGCEGKGRVTIPNGGRFPPCLPTRHCVTRKARSRIGYRVRLLAAAA